MPYNSLLRSSLFISVLSALLCFAACDDSEPVPEEVIEGFPLTYQFINEQTDELRIVNFETQTYYPNEDQTYLSFQVFRPVASQDTVEIRVDGTQTNGRLAYEGCLAVSEFEIWVNLPQNRAYVSTWETPVDTLRSMADSVITYRWPIDTLRWLKLDGLILDL